MVDVIAPTDLPETPYTYRLAVNPVTGDHGYDIGRWPSGADLNDPTQFEVHEHVYGQVDAAARVNALNALPQPKAKAAVDEEDEPHPARHTTARRR